jgi:hypothetical protein
MPTLPRVAVTLLLGVLRVLRLPVLGLSVLGLLLGLLLRPGVLAVLRLLRLLRDALAVAWLSRLLLRLLWLAAVHLAVLSSLAVPREVGRLRLPELAVERRWALLRATLIRPGLAVPVPLL